MINAAIRPIRPIMSGSEANFDHLDAGGRATAMLSRMPRALVYALLSCGVLLSWLMLFAAAARSVRTPGAVTPGWQSIAQLPDMPLPDIVVKFLDLCLTGSADGVASFASLTLMWVLMSVAMMLPSAAPLVRTYCEIADTAEAKGERVVHPLVLVAGYLSVWLAASVGFAGMTVAVTAIANESPVAALTPALASAALAAAGLYQFTQLKHACLKKCRRPFAILFARWTTKPSGMFRLGVEQGLWCLGCCWALMLVMFAVGLMNVFWMALIGLFTIVEKQSAGKLVSRLAGLILLVWSAALLVLSV